MHYLGDMVLEIDDGANIVITKDGYLTCAPRVARTGIQLYRGRELGVADKDIVRIYRDEKEVFNTDSLASFAGKPITDNHPPKMVDASNWKKYSAGNHGSDVLRDGEYVRVPTVISDKALISKVKAGKVQLSAGYGCEIDWTPGTTPTGEAFDGRQTGIRINHTAVVDAARGGKALSIGDNQSINHPLYMDGESNNHEVQPEDTETMTLKTTVIDGITCEMTDTAVQVVTRALDAAKNNFEAFKKTSEEETKKAKDALDVANGVVAKLTTEGATKDAEIVTLKKQVGDAELTPIKLDALVKDRQVVVDKAKTMLPTVVVDGKTLPEIMGQVVTAQLGDAAKDWNADQVKISFDTLTAKTPVGVADTGVGRTARAFSQPTTTQLQAKDAQYDKRDKDLENAWKGPAARA